MRDFIKHFVREPDGAWRCVSFAEITTIMGRIQVSEGTVFRPGTIFMAVDIVKLLEASTAGQKGTLICQPCYPLLMGNARLHRWRDLAKLEEIAALAEVARPGRTAAISK